MSNTHNPRIDDIASRVDRLQSEGFPFLVAVSRVAEILDVSVSTVDSCYGAALTGDYALALDEPDPFDTRIDDWSEDFWR